jgi:hypothetical protein
MPVITVTMSHAAKLWGLDRRTVWLRINSGDLEPIVDPINGKKSFSVEYVREVIENGLPWRRKPSESLAA